MAKDIDVQTDLLRETVGWLPSRGVGGILRDRIESLLRACKVLTGTAEAPNSQAASHAGFRRALAWEQAFERLRSQLDKNSPKDKVLDELQQLMEQRLRDLPAGTGEQADVVGWLTPHDPACIRWKEGITRGDLVDGAALMTVLQHERICGAGQEDLQLTVNEGMHLLEEWIQVSHSHDEVQASLSVASREYIDRAPAVKSPKPRLDAVEVGSIQRALEVINWISCRSDIAPKDMSRLERSSAELTALLATLPQAEALPA
ncbi:hypothetical protein ACUB14_001614 [Pseudomonas aeruginosa]|jgi:hypothetical protein|nr:MULTISPECIES: hypothetical protein [Pseudomonas]AVX92854.1 hypothetical protein PkP19E3_32455 [Pseudomonas koreensis]AWE95932.1 hypothetical protein CSC28_6741 [Pseudomonas paraeruginosa]EJD6675178.1 hypothetical protein [Pseudomonas aeruginosa]EKB9387717.1 hypothetical protein [Pseudomonas aeruginosa]EKD1543868.1 hypothetical protein [Pseudomonas aeruginosa]